ncbi:MAG: TIGR02281 family clan AA aspartic protease [Pseudomonadota bacterium]
MTDFDIPDHVMLTLIVLGVCATYLLVSRSAFGRALRRIGLTAIMGLTALMAVGVWLDIQSGSIQRQSVLQETGEITLNRGFDGHFHATLEINGVPVRMVVDTGASELVLTQEDARRVGLEPENLAFTGRAFTANGPVETAPVRLDTVVLGGLETRGVRAVVNGGEMFDSLLGMSYLSQFESIEIRGRELILRP